MHTGWLPVIRGTMNALTLYVIPGVCADEIRNCVTACFPSLCGIPAIPQIRAFWVKRRRWRDWARRSVTNDAVSNSARVLTIPCGVSTTTWHVINKMLELMDTCIVVDSLSCQQVCLASFSWCDVVVDSACSGLAICISSRNDQGGGSSGNTVFPRSNAAETSGDYSRAATTRGRRQ